MRSRVHKGTTYQVSDAHPAADAFPWLADDELQALADDIKANGQRQPVVRHAGKIVDGRNRELACAIAGVKPKYVDLPDDTTEARIVAGIVSANLIRRHLDPSQRAAVAARLANRRPGQHDVQTDESGKFAALPTQADAAKALNVSERSVRSAAKVQREAPELEQPVIDGKLPVSVAAKLVGLPPEERREIAGADDPHAAALERLADSPIPYDDSVLLPGEAPPPMDDTLPQPSHDASKKLPHHFDRTGRNGHAKGQPDSRPDPNHPYFKILTDMTDLARRITLALNEPGPAAEKLKTYLSYHKLVLHRDMIWNGRKYRTKFWGFGIRQAIRMAGRRGKLLSRDEFFEALGIEGPDDAEGDVSEATE